MERFRYGEALTEEECLARLEADETSRRGTGEGVEEEGAAGVDVGQQERGLAVAVH